MPKSLILSYKYRIGDVFYDKDRDEVVEITGFNSVIGDKVYKGTIRTFMGKGTRVTLESNMIYQARLDNMRRYKSLQELELSKMNKSATINYKIYYFDTPMKVGQNATDVTIKLSGIKKLAEVLNNMKAKNPNRRITMVCIVDDNGTYLTYVKFLRQEWTKQQWLTGYKERMLAHAKYERGYEIATGF
jgi:hypothetical protein